MSDSPSPDFIEKAVSRSAGIAVTYADVTATARECARGHLSGPTAARVLGEGLTAAALLAGVLARDEERLTIQLGCDGPIGGVMAEITGDGTMRGFTYRKILNDLDDDPASDLARAYGQRGLFQVIHSSASATLASGQVGANPPAVDRAAMRYLLESAQTPAALALHAAAGEDTLVCVRGCLCERMPDGRAETFVPILERFESGAFRRALAAEGGLAALAPLFDLPDLEVRARREMRFGCHCSREKTLAMLVVLPDAELDDMIAEETTQTVTCHFCGRGYSVAPDELRQIRALKDAPTPPAPHA